jgi:hypothetical protein
MAEIVNRVANSPLKTFDLESIYVKQERVQLDISQWLFEGFILKEKDFRQALKDFDWTIYKDKLVAIHCSTDAILPSWAPILVASHLLGIASKTIVGDLADLNKILYAERIQHLDLSEFQDKPVIIKGCSNFPVPEVAYILLLEKLQPIAKSVFYGEACSSVPLYKRK